MKTIHFNTGRLYTQFGQRITATLHDDGVVTFLDHDRGVSCEFPCPDASQFCRSLVMQQYDHNHAKQSHRAHRDAFYADSCNQNYVGPNSPGAV